MGERCRRLDGIPLTIELAAARARLLSPPQMLELRNESLDQLKSGSQSDANRQRTLEAAIDWSYELFAAEEQELFDLLSVMIANPHSG